MTTRPELKLGSHLLPGLAAVALFVVMAVTFVQARFPAPAGFPEDANITASIGYAMFNIEIDAVEGTLVAGEGFLVPFEIIDLVLVAALAGAILLARREQGDGFTVLLADGGRKTGRALADGGRALLGRDAEGATTKDETTATARDAKGDTAGDARNAHAGTGGDR